MLFHISIVALNVLSCIGAAAVAVVGVGILSALQDKHRPLRKSELVTGLIWLGAITAFTCIAHLVALAYLK